MYRQQISGFKKLIEASIRSNSDHGYIENKGCILVCTEMMSIIQLVEGNTNSKMTFDIYIMVLLEAVKLFFHADPSSGAATEVIQACLAGISKLCESAEEDNKKHYFNTIIKSAQIKAFRVWPDYGYKLLSYAVCLINIEKQAYRVYRVFRILGTMYDGKDYPDKRLITLGIIERLEGKEAVNKYLIENNNVPELRTIAFDKLTPKPIEKRE